MHNTREYSFRGKTYKVSCSEATPQHASWFTHEDEVDIRNTYWTIQPGDCVFDVGAAYGSYALSALASGAEQVYAWSPQGPPGETLEHVYMAESLDLNGWTGKCTIYPSGVYDRNGWLNTVSQAFSETPPESPNGDIIPVSVLDDWYKQEFLVKDKVESYERFWLKLDVEGAEVQVLRTSTALITDLKPIVFVENHNFKGPMEQGVRDILLAHGYKEIATVPYHSVSHSLYEPIP